MAQYVVPAKVQLPPLPHHLGVLPGYYATQPTTLVMREKIMSFTGDDYHIKSTDGASVLRVRGTVMSLSDRTEVLDNQGQLLFTVRRQIFSLLKNYYAEDPNGNKFLTVDGEFSFGRNKASINFINSSDQQQVQLKMKGDWLDMTTEIKLGDTVVARIDREMRTGWQILGGPQTYFVTVAPNVDLALMVAMSQASASPQSPALLSTPSATSRTPTSSSPARPASRKSNVTRQIFQFALGYPQTPPETSPELEPIDPLVEFQEPEESKNMGSFLFQWNHPAKEVHVTGTFDDWSKSVLLEKKDGDMHEKLVELPRADEKIYYKFVVDENWTTDHTAPQETDSANNTNNVLLPEQITKSQPPTSRSTVAAMASSHVPGSFPETPAAERTGFTDADAMPDNTTKAGEDSQQAFGVSPLPATSGIGNPIQTKPGESVPDPSSFTNNTITSAVTTDKESYERGSGAPQLPDVVTPQKERDARGGGILGLPEPSGGMIPESSLPMGGSSSAENDPGYTIQSSGPQASTAELAAKVPLEPRGVPEIVQESRAEAGFAPEATANKKALEEKTAMEEELDSKVPEEPATAEGTSTANGGTTDKKATSEGEIAGMAAGGAGATAAVAAAAGYASSRGLPASIQQSIDQMNKGTAIDSRVPDVVQESIAEAHVAPEAAASSGMVQEKSAMEAELLKKIPTEEPGNEAQVPNIVQESMAQAHFMPEAAASPEMVQEKSAMEAELLKKVPEEEMSGEPAPSSAAALSEFAPVPTMKSTETPLAMGSTETPSAVKSTETPMTAPMTAPMTSEIPPPVSRSADLPANGSVSASGPGLNAPAAAPARSSMAQALSTPAAESRDVSPMTRGPGTSAQTEPMVTTGVASSSTAASTPAKAAATKAAAPSKSSPMSSKTGESSASGSAETKKKNRASGFFGKLKSKFGDKHKD
ncbi:hypothetical protein MMC18_005248 [Xylographa bjoerkii]|nr:hypothetical protein [Xylographa bjoerkii]